MPLYLSVMMKKFIHNSKHHALQSKADNLRSYLQNNHAQIFEEQKHLDADEQQMYWHYGYYTALADIIQYLFEK